MGSSIVTENMVKLSFFEWINVQENSYRLWNYNYYDNYYNGYQDAPLPSEIRKQFQKPISVICNICKPIVDIPVRYICGNPKNVNIDVTQWGQKTPLADEAERQLTRIYLNSGMFDTEFIRLIRCMIKKGDGFIRMYLVGDPTEPENTDIRLEVVRPDVVYPRYADDNYKAMNYCAIKWFELVEINSRNWYAYVYYPEAVDAEGQVVPGQVAAYDLGIQGIPEDKVWSEDEEGNLRMVARRPQHTQEQGAQARFIEAEYSFFPFIPVYHFRNNVDEYPFGTSDLHNIIDLQDALNRTFTDLMQVLDLQAFQRIFVFGAMSDKEYIVSPAVVTNIPNESGRIDVIPGANVAGFLYSIDGIIDQICMESSTPKTAFAEYAQGLPASGYALKVRYIPLEDKCNEKKAALRGTLRDMNRDILWTLAELNRFDGVEILDGDRVTTIAKGDTETAHSQVASLDVEVHFPGGLPEDKVMEAQMYMFYKQMGVMDDQTIMEKLGIDNIPEVQRRIYEQRVLEIQAYEEARQTQTESEE